MKRLVICCDGTWNVPDQRDSRQRRGDPPCPSNVAKIALATSERDDQGRAQLVYYGKGVGTGRWDRLRGGAFGAGLSDHIRDAYRYVVQYFEPGDELFLFGFSRGAYTARSIAGFIRNSGILRREHRNRLADAYNLYRRRDDASRPDKVEATLFRRSFAHETRIKFIGVWDTVGSLGIPAGIPWLPVSLVQLLNRRWAFHDTDLSSYVDYAYHAVAIDERRPPFKPTLWVQQTDRASRQVLEQVWFAGVHTNVGGGYQDSGLSDLTFQWMKRKAAACGLALAPGYGEGAIQPNPCGELRESKIGFYRLMPDYVRPIGEGEHTNQMVHASAVQRRQGPCPQPYSPPNLEQYLKGPHTIAPADPPDPAPAG